MKVENELLQKQGEIQDAAYSASLASNNGFTATLDTRRYPPLNLSAA